MWFLANWRFVLNVSGCDGYRAGAISEVLLFKIICETQYGGEWSMFSHVSILKIEFLSLIDKEVIIFKIKYFAFLKNALANASTEDTNMCANPVHLKTGKHRNTGKQPKYRKAHINTKKQWKINIYSIMWYVGTVSKGSWQIYGQSSEWKKKEQVCVHVCLCVEFNTAFNNFSVISL